MGGCPLQELQPPVVVGCPEHEFPLLSRGCLPDCFHDSSLLRHQHPLLSKDPRGRLACRVVQPPLHAGSLLWSRGPEEGGLVRLGLRQEELPCLLFAGLLCPEPALQDFIRDCRRGLAIGGRSGSGTELPVRRQTVRAILHVLDGALLPRGSQRSCEVAGLWGRRAKQQQPSGLPSDCRVRLCC